MIEIIRLYSQVFLYQLLNLTLIFWGFFVVPFLLSKLFVYPFVRFIGKHRTLVEYLIFLMLTCFILFWTASHSYIEVCWDRSGDGSGCKRSVYETIRTMWVGGLYSVGWVSVLIFIVGHSCIYLKFIRPKLFKKTGDNQHG